MKRVFALIAAPLLAFSLAACEVEQTEEGELPEIEIEPGQTPSYDVDPALEVTEDTVITPSLEWDTDDDADTLNLDEPDE